MSASCATRPTDHCIPGTVIPEELPDKDCGGVDRWKHLHPECGDPKCTMYVPIGCNKPWCLDCWAKRKKRTFAQIMRYLDHNAHSRTLQFFTFSARGDPDLGVALDHLSQAWKRFRNLASKRAKRDRSVSLGKKGLRFRRHEWHKIDGGVGVLEVTPPGRKRSRKGEWYESESFHPHIHIIVVLKPGFTRISWRAIHKLWNKACRYKAQFDASVIGRYSSGVRDQTSRNVVRYLAPYLSGKKPLLWGNLQRDVCFGYRHLLKGRNFIQRVGSLSSPKHVVACDHGEKWSSCGCSPWAFPVGDLLVELMCGHEILRPQPGEPPPDSLQLVLL